MTVRELASDEWIHFFNAFSRLYKGRPVTVQLHGRGEDNAARTLIKKMPLIGITTGREMDDTMSSIEIIVGDSPSEHFMHVIQNPARVRIAQVTNGADELLFIDEAESGLTTSVDFSPTCLSDSLSPAVFGAVSHLATSKIC